METTGAVRCAKLQSNHHRQQTNTQFFTGQMPFLSHDQQSPSTIREILAKCWPLKLPPIFFFEPGRKIAGYFKGQHNVGLVQTFYNAVWMAVASQRMTVMLTASWRWHWHISVCDTSISVRCATNAWICWTPGSNPCCLRKDSNRPSITSRRFSLSTYSSRVN